jgi:hypothetical protein
MTSLLIMMPLQLFCLIVFYLLEFYLMGQS